MDRREVFFKNDKDNTNFAGLAEFKLKENGVIESYECEADAEGYKNEWNLGDIVTTVSKKYGFIIHNRVNEVKFKLERRRYLWQIKLEFTSTIMGKSMIIFTLKLRDY